MLILGLFSLLFVLFIAVTTDLTLHHMGFFYQHKIQNLDGYIFEKVFTTKKLCDGIPVFRK